MYAVVVVIVVVVGVVVVFVGHCCFFPYLGLESSDPIISVSVEPYCGTQFLLRFAIAVVDVIVCCCS